MKQYLTVHTTTGDYTGHPNVEVSPALHSEHVKTLHKCLDRIHANGVEPQRKASVSKTPSYSYVSQVASDTEGRIIQCRTITGLSIRAEGELLPARTVTLADLPRIKYEPVRVEPVVKHRPHALKGAGK
ncbi:hypothetical protein ACUH93_00690 [Dermabacteraceae bacterium P7006]